MAGGRDVATARQKAIASVAALTLTVGAEGVRQYAYYDPPGILTVCYGHTGPDVEKRRKYSVDECKALLETDMLKAVQAVERCAPGLPDPALVAFSDAAFNLGPAVACDTARSTPARLLAKHDYKGACEALLNWDKARVAGQLVSLPGLTKRRQAERDFCLQENFHVDTP